MITHRDRYMLTIRRSSLCIRITTLHKLDSTIFQQMLFMTLRLCLNNLFYVVDDRRVQSGIKMYVIFTNSCNIRENKTKC